MDLIRCPWLPVHLENYRIYHDQEWGVVSRDRRYLFEMICLEGAQAGLSWSTILNKRAGYRSGFHNFQPEAVAAMGELELEAMVANPAVVRHRGKIFAVRQNARAWLDLEQREGNVVDYLWSFVGGIPRQNRWKKLREVPAVTPESTALSKALRKAGFNFVGPTTLYAFMQAVGMVNDHTTECFRHGPLGGQGGR